MLDSYTENDLLFILGSFLCSLNNFNSVFAILRHNNKLISSLEQYLRLILNFDHNSVTVFYTQIRLREDSSLEIFLAQFSPLPIIGKWMHSSASAKSVLRHWFYNPEMNKGHYVSKLNVFAVSSKTLLAVAIKKCCYCNASFRFLIVKPDNCWRVGQNMAHEYIFMKASLMSKYNANLLLQTFWKYFGSVTLQSKNMFYYNVQDTNESILQIN